MSNIDFTNPEQAFAWAASVAPLIAASLWPTAEVYVQDHALASDPERVGEPLYAGMTIQQWTILLEYRDIEVERLYGLDVGLTLVSLHHEPMLDDVALLFNSGICTLTDWGRELSRCLQQRYSSQTAKEEVAAWRGWFASAGKGWDDVEDIERELGRESSKPDDQHPDSPRTVHLHEGHHEP